MVANSEAFLYDSPDDFNIDFNSLSANTGKYLANNKKNAKNNPIVPRNTPMSMLVG